MKAFHMLSEMAVLVLRVMLVKLANMLRAKLLGAPFEHVPHHVRARRAEQVLKCELMPILVAPVASAVARVADNHHPFRQRCHIQLVSFHEKLGRHRVQPLNNRRDELSCLDARPRVEVWITLAAAAHPLHPCVGHTHAPHPFVLGHEL